ncbi:MAG: hypothetical protein Q7R40_15210 [Phaeospirillum sp.]|nr:hypothetical protein [Phaeospirillum sp.]
MLPLLLHVLLCVLPSHSGGGIGREASFDISGDIRFDLARGWSIGLGICGLDDVGGKRLGGIAGFRRRLTTARPGFDLVGKFGVVALKLVEYRRSSLVGVHAGIDALANLLGEVSIVELLPANLPSKVPVLVRDGFRAIGSVDGA